MQAFWVCVKPSSTHWSCSATTQYVASLEAAASTRNKVQLDAYRSNLKIVAGSIRHQASSASAVSAFAGSSPPGSWGLW